jgi:hypothetical protein
VLRRVLKLRRLTGLSLAWWLWRNRAGVRDLGRFALQVPNRVRAGERSALLSEARRHALALGRR